MFFNFLSWLRQFKKRPRLAPRLAPSRRQPRSVSLELEPLETRQLLTSLTGLTEYNILGAFNLPAIALGPDGNAWFTESASMKIAKITTGGTITEYSLAGQFSYGITAGPDGNLWFTDPAPIGAHKVGKVTTDGIITYYSLPTNSSPHGITSGPDGNLWFTEYSANKIGKVTTSGSFTYSVNQRLPSGPVTMLSGPLPLVGMEKPNMESPQAAAVRSGLPWDTTTTSGSPRRPGTRSAA
jgi:hypothetical protein